MAIRPLALLAADQNTLRCHTPPPPNPPRPGKPRAGDLGVVWGPNGSRHHKQTQKEGSGGQGVLWLLKVAKQTALRGGPDRLKLPADAGPTACGPLGPVTL